VTYLLNVVILIEINCLLAIGFNLILGYGGLLSVAHPMFYAMGAYASALLTLRLGIPIWAAIPSAAIVAAVASIGLSLSALRVSGDYLVIVSLGAQLGVLLVFKNIELTGAASGLGGIPSAFDGAARAPIHAVLLAVVVLAVTLAVRRLMRGAYGRAITAMRNDEEAFAALGRNPRRIKIAIFAAGCGLAGLAGGFYAHYFQFVTPEQFDLFGTTALLTMVVVGGTATVAGPLVGAALMTALPQAIGFLDLPVAAMAPLQGTVFTSLVLLFLFVRPQGLLGGRRAGGGVEAWVGRPPISP